MIARIQILIAAVLLTRCVTPDVASQKEGQASVDTASVGVPAPVAGALELSGAAPTMKVIRSACRPEGHLAGARPRSQVEVGLASTFDSQKGITADPTLYAGHRCE